MKNYVIILFVVIEVTFLNTSSISQNLIPNPGFELYTTCPTNYSQLNNCLDWIAVEKTPDYYNTCSSNLVVDVPINDFGYQPAHSGCAYCGFYSWSNSVPGGWREYFQAKLISTLVVGTKYYFSFNLALCEGSLIYPWTSGTNKMGIRLSTMSYNTGLNDSSPATDNYATFYTDSIITDTINWTTISGSIVLDPY